MTSHIRIPDVSPVAQAMADGTSKIFEFPFPIFAGTDLEVFVGDTPVASGFAVRGAGSSDGGAVIFASAPAAGQRVTIRRRQVYARTDDFLDERAPTPHELNDAVDHNVAALQELADESVRTVKRSATADLSRDVNLTLPEPEASKVLGWNGSANALVNLTQVDVSDMLHKSQNLADLPDKAQARINLGLGSAATHADTDFATAAQGGKADSALQSSVIDTDQTLAANSDALVASQKAVKAYVDGKTSTTEAAALLKSQNLDDLPDKAQARTNLGLAAVAVSGLYTDLTGTPSLGSAAALNVGTGANQVVQLDANGKLPAVDGSAITNLNAGNLSAGTIASARLGSGTADASSFLRGDGTWAALSTVSGGSPFSNVQKFTSSGTFTVPAGVCTVAVMLVGGGGGGTDGSGGSVGGTSSFGTFASAYGGGSGWYSGTDSGSGTVGAGSLDPTATIGTCTTGVQKSDWGGGLSVSPYGVGGTAGWGNCSGGMGGAVFAIVPVTPGQSISVTVGAGGSGYHGGNGAAGVVIVRY